MKTLSHISFASSLGKSFKSSGMWYKQWVSYEYRTMAVQQSWLDFPLAFTVGCKTTCAVCAVCSSSHLSHHQENLCETIWLKDKFLRPKISPRLCKISVFWTADSLWRDTISHRSKRKYCKVSQIMSFLSSKPGMTSLKIKVKSKLFEKA